MLACALALRTGLAGRFDGVDASIGRIPISQPVLVVVEMARLQRGGTNFPLQVGQLAFDLAEVVVQRCEPVLIVRFDLDPQPPGLGNESANVVQHLAKGVDRGQVVGVVSRRILAVLRSTQCLIVGVNRGQVFGVVVVFGQILSDPGPLEVFTPLPDRVLQGGLCLVADNALGAENVADHLRQRRREILHLIRQPQLPC